METNLDQLLRMARGYASSQLILTAVQLDVFTTLSEGPLSGTEIERRLGLHPRGSRAFFDALVSHGLLERTGEMYANTPVAALHLDKNRGETYLGGYLGLADGLYRLWPNLATSLRTGRPCTGFAGQEAAAGPGAQGAGTVAGAEAAGGAQGADREAPMEWSPDYINAMAFFARAAAPALARSVDWARYTSFVDVGGSNGTLASELVRLRPHLRGTCLDLPALREQFEATMARAGTHEKVAFRGGDFFEEPIPETDAVVLGRILHNWSTEDRVKLLRRAWDALRPGGAVLVFDQLLDEQRRDGMDPALSSLDQLLFSEAGSEYSFAELCEWFHACGFRSPSVQQMDGGPEMLAIAFKPR
ncbi:methyltransferase [Streptomyces albus subsp. chlorinus]|uniref:methyltransferase n=1 Tax=Streptomyces albus TaxID=1888 RepID=UPI0015706D1A|nr:methyltransferase [Streptomyces albus]